MDEILQKNFVTRLRASIFASSAYWRVLGMSKPGLPKPLPLVFEGDQQRGQSFRMRDFVEDAKPGEESSMLDPRTFSRFNWLADLQASGLATSVSVAQEMTEIWIERNQAWSAGPWNMSCLTERICNWISSSNFILAGADPDFSRLFAKAMACHANHLEFAVRFGEPLPPGFGAQKAMIYCGIALENHSRLSISGMRLLQKSIDDEIHPDGGHISRNPSLQFEALRHLIEIRTAVQSQPTGAPLWLQACIDKLAPMVRTFIMGDGTLAHFNGARPAEPKSVDAVLKKSEAVGRAATNSPHSGFQRLTARRTIVVIDTGVPSNPSHISNESAGTLSFEMSVGKYRLVVNCGLPSDEHLALTTALRGTSAHSSLSVGDTNSSEISTQGHLGSRRAWRTHSVRREVDKNTLIEAAHDGYASLFGLSHKRSLYLSSDGNELRGEDVLQGSGEQAACVRFHLHPSVHASVVEAGDCVLLKFGKAAGWRFRTSASHMTLAPSIYYDATRRRQCQQIVLTVNHRGPETIVKWRFSMED